MKQAWYTRLLSSLRQFKLAERGVAAVEFALILPVMLIVYIGSVEASLAISMDRRMQTIAGALGDLVARSDTTMSTSTLRDYFQAAEGLMTPYPVTGVRQVVTQVRVDASGNAVTVWSRQYVNGAMTVTATHPVNQPFRSGPNSTTLPTAMTAISKGKFVIVSEASYDYEPLGYAFDQTINLYRENFFMPRFDGSITIN